jgi:hypothetical protein
LKKIKFTKKNFKTQRYNRCECRPSVVKSTTRPSTTNSLAKGSNNSNEPGMELLELKGFDSILICNLYGK